MRLNVAVIALHMAFFGHFEASLEHCRDLLRLEMTQTANIVEEPRVNDDYYGDSVTIATTVLV